MPPGYIKYNPSEYLPSTPAVDLELTLSNCRFLVKYPQITTRENLEAIMDAIDKAVYSLRLDVSEISSNFTKIFECMNFDSDS